MFSQRLKSLRKEKGITQEQLASAIGVERSTVGKYEGSKGNMPSHEILTTIANYFDVSIDFLLGNSTEAKKKGVQIPVLGRVQAGLPIEAIEEILDYEEITEDMARRGEFFGLIIRGDSMSPRMLENDVIIVRKQPVVDSGDIAVILVNGCDATVKKFVRHDDGISLIPFNSAYEPKFYTINEIETFPITILGKVVELRGKL